MAFARAVAATGAATGAGAGAAAAGRAAVSPMAAAAAVTRSLASRTALVTGSTSGIGAAIARSLAAAGCNVVLHGLVSGEEGERLRREFASTYGVRAMVSTHNVAVARETEALAAAAADFGGGGIDILVNNAGIQHISPVDTFPSDKWDAILAINLTSCFHLIRAALPPMRSRRRGRIINIASVHGHVASVNKSAYVAAKHG